ncbi:MAG: hypothetical protein ACLTSZ_08150 [Lachnospiraceae bacterium]
MPVELPLGLSRSPRKYRAILEKQGAEYASVTEEDDLFTDLI